MKPCVVTVEIEVAEDGSDEAAAYVTSLLESLGGSDLAYPPEKATFYFSILTAA